MRNVIFVRDYIRIHYGHKLVRCEHFVYGLTYMMIGFTHLEWLYYAFGLFVFACIAFGDNSHGGEI